MSDRSADGRPGAYRPPPRHTLGGEGITLARVHDAERLTDRVAVQFKALGDPVRLRLLSMIASARGGEVCVCELAPAFDLTSATISHHLRVLRDAGLVFAERRGTFVYYRICLTLLRGLAALLASRTEPAARRPPAPDDRARCDDSSRPPGRTTGRIGVSR